MEVVRTGRYRFFLLRKGGVGRMLDGLLLEMCMSVMRIRYRYMLLLNVYRLI